MKFSNIAFIFLSMGILYNGYARKNYQAQRRQDTRRKASQKVHYEEEKDWQEVWWQEPQKEIYYPQEKALNALFLHKNRYNVSTR
mgnify:CR=1 FL=1